MGTNKTNQQPEYSLPRNRSKTVENKEETFHYLLKLPFFLGRMPRNLFSTASVLIDRFPEKLPTRQQSPPTTFNYFSSLNQARRENIVFR